MITFGPGLPVARPRTAACMRAPKSWASSSWAATANAPALAMFRAASSTPCTLSS